MEAGQPLGMVNAGYRAIGTSQGILELIPMFLVPALASSVICSLKV